MSELSPTEERVAKFLQERGYTGIVPLHTALLLEGKTIEDFEECPLCGETGFCGCWKDI